MALTRLVAPSLTTVNGFFVVEDNNALSLIEVPSLRIIMGYLSIISNDLLAQVSLPSLTHINGFIRFCNNNGLFVIPTGLPHAPQGGFVVTGAKKGTINCVYSNGSDVCDEIKTICP
jgi:hypothetical protein